MAQAPCFIHRYPAIFKAVRLLEQDNGGHLLAFYGVGPELNDLAEAKAIEAANAFSESDLAFVEQYLASLTDEAIIELTMDEHTEDVPPTVQRYLTAAFEADVLDATGEI